MPWSVRRGWVSPQIWKHLRDPSHIHQIFLISICIAWFCDAGSESDLTCIVPQVIKASQQIDATFPDGSSLKQQALLFTQPKCGASFSGYSIGLLIHFLSNHYSVLDNFFCWQMGSRAQHIDGIHIDTWRIISPYFTIMLLIHLSILKYPWFVLVVWHDNHDLDPTGASDQVEGSEKQLVPSSDEPDSNIIDGCGSDPSLHRDCLFVVPAK